jgi:hypothetical protein
MPGTGFVVAVIGSRRRLSEPFPSANRRYLPVPEAPVPAVETPPEAVGDLHFARARHVAFTAPVSLSAEASRPK